MNKEKVVNRLHKKIEKASKKIDELRLQAHLAKADAKVAFDERIKNLDVQKDKFREDVHHLHFLTQTAWEDVAEGCSASWSNLNTSIRKAANEFKA